MRNLGKISGPLLAAIILVLALLAPATGAPARTVPDFTRLGFPTVVAQARVTPATGAVLHAGNVTVAVPAGAVSAGVDFQLLEGPVAAFQSKAPPGQKVLSDFAFKVVGANGGLVAAFGKPVIYTLTSSRVQKGSVYWNVLPSGKWVVNPVPAGIVPGKQLRHGILAAPVGWVVTSPVALVTGATAPVTGLPLGPVLLAGLGLLALGAILLAARRRLGAG
ncbi:MAG: hypothetical protein M0Z41_08265 [Peptococcaceae bacterium]|nr:hypothetical protein [Peptococcaceae bacterium]